MLSCLMLTLIGMLISFFMMGHQYCWIYTLLAPFKGEYAFGGAKNENFQLKIKEKITSLLLFV